jgi:hypothetical protein
MTPLPVSSNKLSSSTPNGKSQQHPKFILSVNGASQDSEPSSPPGECLFSFLLPLLSQRYLFVRSQQHNYDNVHESQSEQVFALENKCKHTECIIFAVRWQIHRP